MSQIRFVPDPARMLGVLTDSPAFSSDDFLLNVPEVIGDASHFVDTTHIAPGWIDLGSGRWRTQAHVPGELDFELTVTPEYDWVDLDVSLTNRSSRGWTHSFAGHCINCGHAPSVADFECARHWARTGEDFRRLIQLPRKYSGRPAVQLYSVEGAPPGMQIPFVESFDATPDVVLDGWLAIQSRDGDRLAAVVSKPSLFLFQNMELGCIHSSPSFGPLQPGQTGFALTRIYLVRQTLDDWFRRMQLELGFA